MLVKFNFLSQALMEQTNVTMILPSWTLFDSGKGKAESYVPGTKFQVLYLLHGGTGDDSDYIHFSNILRYAEEHKIAVVMPSGHNSSYENEPEHVQPWPHRYWDFVFDELPRVCATMFPISTKREDTFVAGLSMGSMGAAKWAVYGPERVCAAVLMSGGGMDTNKIMQVVGQYGSEGGGTDFNVDVKGLKAQGFKLIDTDDKLYRTARENVVQGKPLPKLFMTCGGNDFIRIFAHECRDILKGYGYDVFYEEIPGYAHEWDFATIKVRPANRTKVAKGGYSRMNNTKNLVYTTWNYKYHMLPLHSNHLVKVFSFRQVKDSACAVLASTAFVSTNARLLGSKLPKTLRTIESMR